MREQGLEQGLEHKLGVLQRVARALNQRGAVWALGGSALLYFKGRVRDFHDLDLMVLERDVPKLVQALCGMGSPMPARPSGQYRTRRFLKYRVDGVEVDVMAGLVIVRDGVAYDCALREEQIAERVLLGGEEIPLQSLADWRRYYELMGRPQKAALIGGEA